MNLYIAELKQGKGIINAQPNKQHQEALVSLRSENTDLKRKIAETSQLVECLKRENESKLVLEKQSFLDQLNSVNDTLRSKEDLISKQTNELQAKVAEGIKAKMAAIKEAREEAQAQLVKVSAEHEQRLSTLTSDH